MRVALRGSAVRNVPHGALNVVPGAGNTLAKSTSFPAPVGGWDAVSSLANMKEDRAIALDNWFPRPDSIEVRRGYVRYAYGMGSGVVDSLMVYHGVTPIMNKLFAATGGSIWDITAGGGGTVTTNTGMTNNRWQWVNFTTAGGNFLWICNGANTPRYYNGSTWTLTSITGITSTDIINVNAHKHRLWFVLASSTKAAYLPVDSITGVAAEFDLGAFFTKGGYLVAMATWTRDGGSGSDDFAVFISSRGQVILYQGDDPTSASTWSQVGVFDIGAPIGRRCFTKVGGELALINVDGVLPLSIALQQDQAAAKQTAMTRNINNIMNESAKAYKDNFGWQLAVYAKGTAVFLNVPITEGSLQHQYVMNTLTGAWCRYIGWNANCFAVFNDRLFFGGNDGSVSEADKGALDDVIPITATGQTAYNYFKSRGILKNFGLARAMVISDATARPAIGMSTDFQDNASLGTPTTTTSVTALYGTAIYGVDVYAQTTSAALDWTGIAVQGHCASMHFRAQTGDNSGVSYWDEAQWDVDNWSFLPSGSVVVRISAFDVIYSQGGYM